MIHFSSMRSLMRLCVATFLWGTGYVARRNARRVQPLVRVLLVHHMRDAQKSERMLRSLTRRYNVLSYEAFVRKEFVSDKINVLLTFDDGYASWAENGAPLFQKYAIQPILFLSSGFLSTVSPDVFATQNLLLPVPESPLSWNQVRALHAQGCVIGGHTVSHLKLPVQTDDVLAREIADDKRAIEQELGAPLHVFAYPFGYADQRVRDAARAAGYQHAFATQAGFVDLRHGDAWNIPRTNHGTVSPFVLRLWVEGAMDIVLACESRVRQWIHRS